MTEEKSKGVTKLADSLLISSPEQFKKIQALDVGKAQNRQCQHLGPDFRQLSTGKKTWGYLKKFLRKKMICSKKVTKLADMTVSLKNFIFQVGSYQYYDTFVMANLSLDHSHEINFVCFSSEAMGVTNFKTFGRCLTHFLLYFF
jgi:hypothetical protein